MYDSGIVLNVSKASAYTITLPAPSIAASGCNYKFVSGAVAANIVTITGGANTAFGVLTNSGGSVATGVTNVTFTATSVRGDVIEVVCDGTAWNYRGSSSVAAGLA